MKLMSKDVKDGEGATTLELVLFHLIVVDGVPKYTNCALASLHCSESKKT